MIRPKAISHRQPTYFRKDFEDTENQGRSPHWVTLQSMFNSQNNSTVRSRQSNSTRTVAQVLSIPQLKLLYKAKCEDLGIPVLPDQEKRFFVSCQNYFQSRRFHLKDMNLGQASAKAIGRVLSMNTNLAFVCLGKNIFGDKGAASLCKKVKNSQHLVHLDISSNDLSCEGSAKVLEHLAGHCSIVSLDISSHEGLHRNRLGTIGSLAVSRLLQTSSMLTHLNLAGTSIGNEGLSYLTAGVRDNPTLLSLDVSSNNLSEGLHSFFSAVAHSFLLKLDVSNNKLGNEGAGALSELIAGSYGQRCPVKTLLVKKDGITIKGLLKLFGAMRLNISLETVNLDENNFAAGLSSEFVSFMQGNKVLKTLSLNACKVSDEAAIDLKEGLAINQALTGLHLTGNLLGNGAAGSISLGLAKNTSLKTLNLASNKIKTQGGVALANALRVNKTLEHLNLRCNKFNNQIAEQYLEVTRINTTIRSIKLDENLIDLKYLHDINENLTRNQKLHQDSLVPQLKANIKKLTVGTVKRTRVSSTLRKKERERTELADRVNRQLVRLEDIREREEEKTAHVVAERQQVKQRFLTISQSLINVETTQKQAEVHFNRQCQELTDKITIVAYEVKTFEKLRAKKREQFYMKRSYTSSLITDLQQQLYREEIAQKTTRSILDSLKKQLSEAKAPEPTSGCRHKLVPKSCATK